jgi:hypothetical protein
MTNEYDALRRALDHAMAQLNSLGTSQIPPSVGVDELRKILGKDLGEEGISPEQVIDDRAADVDHPHPLDGHRV